MLLGQGSVCCLLAVVGCDGCTVSAEVRSDGSSVTSGVEPGAARDGAAAPGDRGPLDRGADADAGTAQDRAGSDQPVPDAGGAGADRMALDAGPACGDFCEPFSIAVLPDTQYYTSKQEADADNTYFKQIQWILDHREDHDIRFVIHLGDITNSNTPAQWEIADAAHAMLDLAGVPYSVVTGNHDYLVAGLFERGLSLFDVYFGPARFAGRPWYGGSLGSSNENNFALFEVGPLKFMVISLEYGPRKESLCWADELIAEHPDRRVIIVSHCIMTHNGDYDSNCPKVDYGAIGGDGATIWDELLSRHSNVFLALCGHNDDSEYLPRPGNPGSTVHQILVDYQFEAACTAVSAADCTAHCQDGLYTGNGWLRELVFAPRENRVYARTITVETGNRDVFPGGEPAFFCSAQNAAGKNWYASDPQHVDHQFAFGYDLSTPVRDVLDDRGRLGFNDLTVNSVSAGDQLGPRLALAADGRFAVVWEDDSSSADGSGNHDIMARGFAAGGCQGFAQIAVNTETAGQQRLPAVAMADDGRFVAVWEDDSDGNGVFQIHARGFAADGSERIARFTVNAQAAGQQRNPAVAMAPDGRFAVAWEDDGDGDGNYQVRMAGFTAAGGAGFSERSAHQDAAGQRLRPAVAMAGDGRIVVVWEDDSDGNGLFQIHARGFAADGSERIARFTVNTRSAGQQRRPAVGTDALGGFAVAWEDDQEDDGDFQILARGFEPDGSQRFGELVAHSTTGGQHLRPTIGMAPGGDFALAWEDDRDGNGKYQIRARVFSAAGVELQAEWTVNRLAAGQQRAPSLALGAGGVMVVAWEDDLDGNGKYQILARGEDLPTR
ncbi:MAG: metallophosphoesterase [Deltaproteobacteria bacterium]|nr:metallophosphoesterase [Deltaproteobacteria bacterium]